MNLIALPRIQVPLLQRSGGMPASLQKKDRKLLHLIRKQRKEAGDKNSVWNQALHLASYRRKPCPSQSPRKCKSASTLRLKQQPSRLGAALDWTVVSGFEGFQSTAFWSFEINSILGTQKDASLAKSWGVSGEGTVLACAWVGIGIRQRQAPEPKATHQHKKIQQARLCGSRHSQIPSTRIHDIKICPGSP